MKISKLQIEDIRSLFNLENNLFGNSNMKSIGSSLSNKNTDYYIIKIRNKIIGFCHINYMVDECEIVNFGIDKDHRSKSYGTKLLLYVFEKLRRKGISSIFLEVRENNYKAIRLYRRRGFIEVGKRVKYYKNGEDALLLKKVL